jgi:hypothetical protein
MKRLYVVTVGFEYACLADSPAEASSFAMEAVHEIHAGECAHAAPLRWAGPDDPIRPRGWDDDSLVYQSGFRPDDITLGDAIKNEKRIHGTPTGETP